MSSEQRISAYTPSNMDREVLRRIFVQRETLLERIVDRLANSMTAGDKDHILLVGPRGSGKTCMVSLAAWELQKKEELSDVMRIAWLGEDDTFSGLIHFAFGIAKALADGYPEEFPADFKSDVRGLPQDDAALSVLNSVVKNLKHRQLLVITENLDQTFSGLGDTGQKKLRAFLQETRRFATLATSQQLFAGVSSRKEAFFGFFDTQHLKPLEVDDATQLISNIAREQDKPELVQFLTSTDARYRIRALHHLAGGNHRMYVLLAEFLTQDTLDDLVSAFEELAEQMTPYFQERLRSLPDQQRQLVQCLCDAEGAMTVKEVAEETFIAEGNCSKQLGNLKAKGYVRSQKRGKESYYDMAEPLMRLCLEVKNQRGRPLRLVARFLRAWFPVEKLQQSASKLEGASRAAEYCQAAVLTDNSFESVINDDLMNEIREKIEANSFDDAMRLAEELLVSDPLNRLWYKGSAALFSGDHKLAISHFSDIIDTADVPAEVKAKALFLRGVTHEQMGDTNAAMASYTAVIEMADAPAQQKAQALFNRGVTRRQLNDTDSELDDYTAVIAMADAPADQKAQALFNRGVTLGQLGDADAAMADYTAVITMSNAPPESKARALLKRGVTHGQLGDTDAAMADYAAVITTSEASAGQKAHAIYNRGTTHARSGNADEALADFTAVITMPDAPAAHKAKTLVHRGVTLGRLGNTEAELADYTTVITMPNAPTDQKAHALLNRGVFFWRHKKWQASLNDFEQGTSIAEVSSELRTTLLFAAPEPMVPLRPRQDVLAALTTAFEDGDRESEDYGGTPNDLLAMILKKGHSDWADYVAAITPLFVQHGVAEKLGQGITQSIQHLDEGGFSESQWDIWNNAWQAAGKDCEDLQIPLECLDAAVDVMKSDPPTDRPLFRLPLEIRQLVRPLLNITLGSPENN